MAQYQNYQPKCEFDVSNNIFDQGMVDALLETIIEELCKRGWCANFGLFKSIINVSGHKHKITGHSIFTKQFTVYIHQDKLIILHDAKLYESNIVKMDPSYDPIGWVEGMLKAHGH